MALPEERLRVAPIDRTAAVAQPYQTTRVSWGGVWSGVLVAVGVLLLLGVLGLAVGTSAVDVGANGSGARGLGVGAGVWTALTLLIALFVAGMVAAKMGMVADPAAATMQGTLVWVLSVLGLIYLGVSGVSLGASALFSVLGGVTTTVGSAVGTGASGPGDLTMVLSLLAAIGGATWGGARAAARLTQR